MPGADLTTLTDQLRGRLVAFVRGKVGSREVAEDLVQETFLRASRVVEGTEIVNVQAWLFQIARNAVADHFRGSREQVKWDDETHGETSDHPTVLREDEELRDELAACVRQVVNTLAPQYRRALLATEYEGLTQKELAGQERITLSAAKSRVQRARALVKQLVEECCRVATDRYGQVTECEPRRDRRCR